ncbi:6-phosphofructokinase [Paludibacterium purpuratum]|uniref:Pyrophosphate--fructose 6-phosphate 1-phosphotransferase n=1 Tax=Paludibacterium purpuratum TaxID=1144873 RepID=A0A4R7B3B0_9NEIS|nr:6-phosphofructokinase [Paludibacterium purpuratum]TDR76493.1 6-phosphofructokinase 1 [Paludibacterium purpuratum]
MTASPLLYLQSGGPTAVLNASAQGVIEAARRLDLPLYAARDGLAGLVKGELVDTTRATDAEIARLSTLPGASFGVSRHMLPTWEEAPQEWLALRDVLERHDIHHLLINGGNGSIGCAARFVEFEQHTGYPLRVIGIPKTIDNDLVGTDFSPGFPSAARFLATQMREVAVDMASMAQRRIFIMETMGRHTGWLAASTAAAAQYAGDAPQLILLPEATFDAERFLRKVRQSLDEHGHCAIAVAEGLEGADGRPLAEFRPDATYGHEQLGGVGTWLAGLVKRELGMTSHVAQVDCLQRAARHLASAVDLRLAHQAGSTAVEWAVNGKQGVMTAFARRATDTPSWEVEPVPLASIGDRERRMPAEFIDADNLWVTPAYLDYLRPLLAGPAAVPWDKDGLPDCRAIDWVSI